MKKKSLLLILSIIISSGLLGQDIDYEAEGDHAMNNGNYEEAISYFDKAIAENDSNDYNFYLRGVSKFRTFDYAGAIADFTRAIDLSPSNKNQWWSEGTRSLKIGTSYTTSLGGKSLEHKYYYAYFYRGQSKLELGDYRGAITDFNKVVSIDKELASAYSLRGICNYNLNEFEKAIQDFSIGIKMNPKDGIAHYYKGTCHLNIGQTEIGCMDLSRAGELGISEAYDLIKEHCK
jgi:tetratricopeptide (TPR) repeat protein